MLGVGQDLSPHYRLNLEQFRRWHPESTLGDPGPSQVSGERDRQEYDEVFILHPGIQHGSGFV